MSTSKIDVDAEGAAAQVSEHYLQVTEFHRVVVDGTVYVYNPGDRVERETAKAHGLLAGSGPKSEQPASEEPELSRLKRAELDKLAAGVGVEEPEKLPNKGAVIAAIRDAEAQQEPAQAPGEE
jgi:hypothetical protein